MVMVNDSGLVRSLLRTGCQWLQNSCKTMTGLVARVTIALVAMETAAHSRQCRQFTARCVSTSISDMNVQKV